jgi:hypothetical protein
MVQLVWEASVEIYVFVYKHWVAMWIDFEMGIIFDVFF